MKYIILKSYNDYDCGTPCAEIVNDILYMVHGKMHMM